MCLESWPSLGSYNGGSPHIDCCLYRNVFKKLSKRSQLDGVWGEGAIQRHGGLGRENRFYGAN